MAAGSPPSSSPPPPPWEAAFRNFLRDISDEAASETSPLMQQMGGLSDGDRLVRSETCGVCHQTLSVSVNDHMTLMHPGCGFPVGHALCGRMAGRTQILIL